ncbi:VOC family protein [Corynebacterium sp. 335C]
MPAFPAEFGMPVRVDLESSAPRTSERFLRSVLGWRFAGEGERGRVALLQGMPLAAVQPAGDGGSQWRVSFHVDDVAGAVDRARELGAEVAQEPVTLPDGAAMAIVADPGGALVGLLGPADGPRLYVAGEPGAPVWFELIAGPGADFDEVVRFYHELFGWEIVVHARDGGGGYAVAVEEDAAFAGIAAGAGAAGEGAGRDWAGWLAYLGVEDLAGAVRKAADAGGEVIVEPQLTDFGPLATVADPAGAVTVLCEVPPPPVEEIHESDPLEGIDLSEFGFGPKG